MVRVFHREADFLFCEFCGIETEPEDRPASGSYADGPRFDSATGARRLIRYRVCPRRTRAPWWRPGRFLHTAQRIERIAYPFDRIGVEPRRPTRPKPNVGPDGGAG